MAAKQSLSFALEPRASAAFDDYVVDIAWSPDGKSFAIAGGEGKVALARVAGESLTLDTVGEHLLGTLSVAWQPHGKVFATSGQDSAIALWDGDAGKEIRRWKPAPTPTQALALFADRRDPRERGRQGGDVVVADRREDPRVRAAASSAVALAFDRPGTDLGVALNGELAVHRIEKSRYETRRYKWPAACLTVNFSGNGRFLASGMADGSLHFWNRSTGKDSQMRGYDGKLELVGWSDNSRYLASCAGNEVVLWDFGGKGPEGTQAHRAERPHRTRRQLRLAARRRISRERRSRLAAHVVAPRARPNNRSTCRCSIPKSAWCAGRPTANA